MSKVALGFIPEPINVLLDQMLPSRRIPEGLTLSVKFQQIKSSIDDVGLIEPLIVGPAEPSTGKRPLIDGHIRAYAMQEL